MLISLITLLSLVVVSPVMASEVESLRGMKRFAIKIEILPLEIEKEGFNVNTIKTDVELKLRLAGIKIITEKEHYSAPWAPWLGVHVQLIKLNQRAYVYSISVTFHQLVNLILTNKRINNVITWESGYIGYTPESAYDAFQKIRGSVKDLVDTFINAYLSVNPK